MAYKNKKNPENWSTDLTSGTPNRRFTRCPITLIGKEIKIPIEDRRKYTKPVEIPVKYIK